MMFEEESVWIGDKISKIDTSSIQDVIDIGSSTLKFRTIAQPYIDKNIFKPLREKGVRILHLDQKNEEGVDIVCDITKLDRLNKKYDFVICTSLLEHIKDVKKVSQNLNALVKEGGYLLITVPFRYRYHKDPIDMMYRPSNKDLEKLFTNLKPVYSEIIAVNKPTDRVGKILKFFNIKWKVSCVLFRK